ncbi:AbrB family transcriptional regulator [Acidianus ambivalens]|uniref:AbrB family transcriptional regulator n=1 Tax=Acidianus ambivalens TaxID=2283 RepID=UPI001E39D386|nr:AbrB family transcriptional regulator [Acidianus ambivalens]
MLNTAIIIVKATKDNTICIPKDIAERAGIKERDHALIRVKDESTIEIIPRKYWAEITADEIEEVGEEISRSLGI